MGQSEETEGWHVQRSGGWAQPVGEASVGGVCAGTGAGPERIALTWVVQAELRGSGRPEGEVCPWQWGSPHQGGRASPQHEHPCVTLSKSPTLSELPSSPTQHTEGEMPAQSLPSCGHSRHLCSHTSCSGWGPTRGRWRRRVEPRAP